MSKRSRLLLSVLTAACSAAVPPPSGPAPLPDMPQVAAQPTSLFPTDAAVLPDSVIRRILTHELALPARNRIAILQLGGRTGYYRTAAAVGRLTDLLALPLIERLTASPRVASAVLFPALLRPADYTVPYLREAAARFQADLLFIIRPDCETFHRRPMFSADRVRASCTVEALILDVRTGVVPFSAAATKDSEARQVGADFGFSETVIRAELDAIGQALKQIGDDAVRFIDAAARLP